jgi:hypothetical protein
MKLGIFWINDDGTIFMTHKVAFDTASRGDSYRVDEMSHPKFWLQNISALPLKYQNKNYQEVPRGRVAWDSINNKVLVFLNEEFVDNKTTQEAVKKEFGLDEADFLHDDHYMIISKDKR